MTALARTALRLAVIEALNADLTLQRMVKGCIYDSRIVDLESTEPVPVIAVYTEDENGDAYSRNNGGPPFNGIVDLVFEISVRAVVPAEDGAEPDLYMPYTDRELEASLDLIEERVINAATVAPTKQSLLVRQAVARRFTRMRSSRYTLQGGDKVANRLLTLTVELKSPEPDDLLTPVPGVFGALPDPLRAVCEGVLANGSIDPHSTSLATCKAILAQWTAPSDTQFRGADITYVQSELTGSFDPITDPSGPIATDPADQPDDLRIKQDVTIP